MRAKILKNKDLKKVVEWNIWEHIEKSLLPVLSTVFEVITSDMNLLRYDN